MMEKLITYEATAELIKNGTTVAATAFGMGALPEKLFIGLQERYAKEQQPKRLTFVSAGSLGNGKRGSGLDRLAAPGLLQKLILSHISLSPFIAEQIANNEIAAYFMPQGIITDIYQSSAKGGPGVLSKIGLHTFLDPRLEGGKANLLASEDLIERVSFAGDEWLKYPNLAMDVALIRATTADTEGNLTVEHEPAIYESLSLAIAAKNNGGIVIAQVERIVEAGSLKAKDVAVPGVLVDFVVVSKPEHQPQTAGTIYKPAFSGESKAELTEINPLPLNVRKVIARRAALELSSGDVINLGFGMADGVAAVALEEGVADEIVLTLDVGVIGGLPARGIDYGASYNPEAMISHNDMMTWYDGGGLDLAVLSFGQIDQYGNVNVSKLNGKIIGPGGFINISQGTQRVIFVGQFTVGGEYAFANDEMTIAEAGRHKKFVAEVEQVTFSGAYAQEKGQQILYVTERAVFDLHEGQVRLIELAPGVDLQRDVLDWMDFEPLIADEVRTMSPGLFREKWGELKDIIGERK